MTGGLLGVLIHSAFAKPACLVHGPIATETFPPQHRSMITMRRVMKLGGAVVLLLFVLLLILLRAFIR